MLPSRFVSSLAIIFCGLNFISCQKLNSSEVQSMDEIYQIPGAKNDTPENIKHIRFSNLRESGVVKCFGIDKKKFVYARIEVSDGQLRRASIGGIKGKYIVGALEMKSGNGRIEFSQVEKQASMKAFQSKSLQLFFELTLIHPDEKPVSKEVSGVLNYISPLDDTKFENKSALCQLFQLNPK